MSMSARREQGHTRVIWPTDLFKLLKIGWFSYGRKTAVVDLSDYSHKYTTNGRGCQVENFGGL